MQGRIINESAHPKGLRRANQGKREKAGHAKKGEGKGHSVEGSGKKNW